MKKTTEQELAAAQEQIAAIIKERDTLAASAAQVEGLNAQVTALTGERDTATAANTQLTADLDSACARNAELNNTITALTGEKTALAAEKVTLTNKVAQLEADKQDFDTRVAAAAAEIAASSGANKPAKVTPGAKGEVTGQDKAKAINQHYAHLATLATEEEKRAYYLKHIKQG